MKIGPEMMEQKRPADILAEILDGLCLEGEDWKRRKKGNFKKRTKNGAAGSGA